MNAGLDEPQLSAISSSHSSHDNLDLTLGDRNQVNVAPLYRLISASSSVSTIFVCRIAVFIFIIISNGALICAQSEDLFAYSRHSTQNPFLAV